VITDRRRKIGEISFFPGEVPSKELFQLVDVR